MDKKIDSSRELLQLLATCQPTNVALAQTLAEGLGVDIPALLKEVGLAEVGFRQVADFLQTEIKFTHKKIRSLEAIACFAHLQTLKVNYNFLSSLAGLEKWQQLAELNASNNALINIRGISKLHFSLSKLNLSFNQLSEVLDLQQITHLEHLDISHNQILSLEGVQSQTNLQYLACYYNQLKKLDCIAPLTQLTYLNCAHNQLKNMQVVENFTSLTRLFCYHNALQNLNWVQNLCELTHLNASQNQLKGRADWLAPLQKLEILDISNNQITDISPLLEADFPFLERAYFKNNPIPPAQIDALIAKYPQLTVSV
jgi:Leucine-rich repeat (LRR) protein